MKDPVVRQPPWTIEEARDLYNIQRWGANYFNVNDAGKVVVSPVQEQGDTVAITAIIEEALGRAEELLHSYRVSEI